MLVSGIGLYDYRELKRTFQISLRLCGRLHRAPRGQLDSEIIVSGDADFANSVGGRVVCRSYCQSARMLKRVLGAGVPAPSRVAIRPDYRTPISSSIVSWSRRSYCRPFCASAWRSKEVASSFWAAAVE